MNSISSILMHWNRLQAARKADLPALTAARARDFVHEYPECGPAWTILGATLLDLGRFDEAFSALDESIHHCPDDKLWIPYCELGHVWRTRGDYATAERCYRAAVKNASDEAGPYIHLGGLLASSGRFSEAEAVYRTAVECPKGCRDEAYMNLGLVLRSLGRLEEAERCFENALKIDPKYRIARTALRDVRCTLQLIDGPRRPNRGVATEPGKRRRRSGVRTSGAAVA